MLIYARFKRITVIAASMQRLYHIISKKTGDCSMQSAYLCAADTKPNFTVVTFFSVFDVETKNGSKKLPKCGDDTRAQTLAAFTNASLLHTLVLSVLIHKV